MTKPITRRHTQKTRRFAKERHVILASRVSTLRFNVAERLRANAERVMSAIESYDFVEGLHQ